MKLRWRAPPASASCARRTESDPVACAPSSRRLVDLARRVAVSDCTVLVVGESGTGKEVLARFIHRRSPRGGRPFVAVNCAAIPENMLEAMLFGYERGSFTGAHAAHPGKFEQAQGGTLLLDEVTEMPLGLQAKLLRVLQEREVERLGGRMPVSLDVRVHRHHQPPAARGSRRRPLPRRPLLPSQRISARHRAAAAAPGRCAAARHAAADGALPSGRAHSGAERRGARSCCSPMAGRATCASSTTCCSARSSWSTARSSGPSTFSSSSRTSCLSRARTRQLAAAADAGRSLAGSLVQAERDLILDALRNNRQPPRGRRAPRHQPAHPALQARPPARSGHRRTSRLTGSTMSQMEIDQVLAQIRSLSTQMQPSAAQQPAAPASGPSDFATLLRQGIDQVNQSEQTRIAARRRVHARHARRRTAAGDGADAEGERVLAGADRSARPPGQRVHRTS